MLLFNVFKLVFNETSFFYIHWQKRGLETGAQLHETHIPGSQVQSAGRPFESKLLCVDFYNSMSVINLFREQWQNTE